MQEVKLTPEMFGGITQGQNGLNQLAVRPFNGISPVMSQNNQASALTDLLNLSLNNDPSNGSAAQPQMQISPVEQLINQETQKVKDLYKNQFQNIDQVTKASEQGLKREAGIYQQAAQAEQQRMNTIQDLKQRYTSFAEERGEDLKDYIDTMVNTEPSKSLGDFLGEKSTGQKIGWALAMSFSGATAKQGNPMLLNLMNKWIDSDLQKQKDQYNKTKDIFNAKKTYWSMAAQKFDNELMIENSARAAMVSKFINQINAAQQSTKSEVIKANAEITKNGLLQQLDQTAQGIRKGINEQFFRQSMIQELSGQGTPDQIPSAVLQEVFKNDPEKIKTYVPGEGFTLIPEDAAKAKTELSPLKTMSSTLDKVIDFRNRFGTEKIPSEALSEARAYLTDLKTSYGVLKQLGALSKEDLKIVEEVIGKDPGQIGYLYPKLIAAKDILNRRMNDIRKTYNLPAKNIGKKQGSGARSVAKL